MTPHDFNELVLPSLHYLEEIVGIAYTREAHVLVMTIAGQESNWDARKQHGGPARSYWQFEQGGGVAGVLGHPASSGLIRKVCAAIDVEPCDTATVYEAMAWHDFLACSMARLLLYTDAAPLPAVGAVSQAWQYYLRNWRPGAPHPDAWPALYQTALELLPPAKC